MILPVLIISIQNNLTCNRLITKTPEAEPLGYIYLGLTEYTCMQWLKLIED